MIQPFASDGLGYRLGHQQINGKACLDPGPDLRGGYAQRETGQGALSKRSLQETRCFAWPGDDDEFNQPREFVGRAPLGQLWNVIGPNQIEKLRLRKAARFSSERESLATLLLRVGSIVAKAASGCFSISLMMCQP